MVYRVLVNLHPPLKTYTKPNEQTKKNKSEPFFQIPNQKTITIKNAE